MKSKQNLTFGQLTVNWDQLRAGQYTPRCTYDLIKLNQLATSIKAKGIAQPLLVKPDVENGKQIYWIVAGERRYRAAKLAGLNEIPVFSKEMTNPEAREYALLENTQREDLTDKDLRALIDSILGVSRVQPKHLKIRDLEKRILSGAKKRKPQVQKKLEKHLMQIEQLIEAMNKLLENA